MDKYLGEFDFRYNHRKMDDGPRTDIAIGRIRGKRLTMKDDFRVEIVVTGSRGVEYIPMWRQK